MPCWGWGPGPPWLQPPSRCLSPRGSGTPPGEQGGSWAPHPPRGFPSFFLFPAPQLFFRSAPIKVFFPTRCCSRRPVMGRGHPAMLLAAPPSPSPQCQRAQPHIPLLGGSGGDSGQGPQPHSLLPVPHCDRVCQGQARRWGRCAGSRRPRQGRRRGTGRWAAWREVARRGGRAKVGSGFSCSDCLSPPQRFLLPGRKPVAGGTMNYSGAEMAPWVQAGDLVSLSPAGGGVGMSTVPWPWCLHEQEFGMRDVPAMPLPASPCHAPGCRDPWRRGGLD